ncbi:hypothetical protein E2C01_007504 [Portunus trituberculatus]|uniref:Uncharacterized protein n=1 Tax=Portunus trituberculatus TaxID=210409 RepID=A0A5B7D4E0_PORTR|nr:hypothetical protein [Portunus trituberculatus]
MKEEDEQEDQKRRTNKSRAIELAKFLPCEFLRLHTSRRGIARGGLGDGGPTHILLRVHYVTGLGHWVLMALRMSYSICPSMEKSGSEAWDEVRVSEGEITRMTGGTKQLSATAVLQ